MRFAGLPVSLHAPVTIRYVSKNTPFSCLEFKSSPSGDGVRGEAGADWPGRHTADDRARRHVLGHDGARANDGLLDSAAHGDADHSALVHQNAIKSLLYRRTPAFCAQIYCVPPVDASPAAAILPSLPANRYQPSTALNTTAEIVLNRSKMPNTDYGNTFEPTAPTSIAARQSAAHTPRERRFSFLALTAISTSDTIESSTTKTVIARCMKFWKIR